MNNIIKNNLTGHNGVCLVLYHAVSWHVIMANQTHLERHVPLTTISHNPAIIGRPKVSLDAINVSRGC